jgi:hypothetical protein
VTRESKEPEPRVRRTNERGGQDHALDPFRLLRREHDRQRPRKGQAQDVKLGESLGRPTNDVKCVAVLFRA